MAYNLRKLFKMEELEQSETDRNQISFRELAACIRGGINAPGMENTPMTLVVPRFMAAQIADMMDYCGDLFLGGIPEELLPEPLDIPTKFVTFKDTDFPDPLEES